MYRRILVVVTDQPESQAAVREGIGLAQVHGAELLFFSALPNYAGPVVDLMPALPSSVTEEAEREIRRHAERQLSEARLKADASGVRSQTLVAVGTDPVTFITATARDRLCDLIVVGTEPRNALMRILTGSVIPGLITQAKVPVLVCHPVAAAVEPASVD